MLALLVLLFSFLALMAFMLARRGGDHRRSHASRFVALGCLALVACASSTAKKDVTVVTHAFETCAAGDATAAISQVAALLPAVLAIVAAGAVTWEADLDAIALKVGDDAVTCAIDAIEAMLAPPAAAGSGAKVAATLSPALVRLETYRAKLVARRTAVTK